MGWSVNESKKAQAIVEPEIMINLNGKTLWQGTVEDFKKTPAALRAIQKVAKSKKTDGGA